MKFLVLCHFYKRFSFENFIIEETIIFYSIYEISKQIIFVKKLLKYKFFNFCSEI